MTDNLTKTALGTAVGIGAVGLAMHSMKMIPKTNLKAKSYKKMPQVKTKPLVKGALDLMVGATLLSGAASAINNI